MRIACSLLLLLMTVLAGLTAGARSSETARLHVSAVHAIVSLAAENCEAEQPCEDGDLTPGEDDELATATPVESLPVLSAWTRYEDPIDRAHARHSTEVSGDLFAHSLQLRHVRLQV